MELRPNYAEICIELGRLENLLSKEVELKYTNERLEREHIKVIDLNKEIEELNKRIAELESDRNTYKGAWEYASGQLYKWKSGELRYEDNEQGEPATATGTDGQ